MSNNRRFITSLLLLVSAICSSSARAVNVFGVDDRTPNRSTERPFSAIGKLYMPGASCTATLVGPDIILTAAHCIAYPKAEKLREGEITFSPQVIDGKSSYSAKVVFGRWGSLAPNQDRKTDWAVLRLDKKLGDQVGFLGYSPIGLQDAQSIAITHVGYSGDFLGGQTAGVHQGCRITEEGYRPDTWHSNCDWNKGASGGPIFFYSEELKSWQIIAISVAQNVKLDGTPYESGVDYDRTTANVAVPATQFSDAITIMRNQSDHQN